MALVTLQFNPVDAARREPLPEGSYNVQVTSVANAVSQAGNPMLKVELDVVNDPQHTGRRLYDNVVLTQNCAWKLVQVMGALRVAAAENFNPDEWIGKTLWVDVGQEPYTVPVEKREGPDDNGQRMRNVINKYRAGN